MKFLKKMFKYLGVLVAIITCIAGVKVVSFLLSRPAEEIPEDIPSSGQDKDSAINKILDKVLSMENGEFDLNFDIVTSTQQEFNVDANLIVDMGFGSAVTMSTAHERCRTVWRSSLERMRSLWTFQRSSQRSTHVQVWLSSTTARQVR